MRNAASMPEKGSLLCAYSLSGTVGYCIIMSGNFGKAGGKQYGG